MYTLDEAVDDSQEAVDVTMEQMLIGKCWNPIQNEFLAIGIL